MASDKEKVNLLKKNFLFIFLILILGLTFLIPLYRKEFYISHDAESIIAKSAATYKSISDLQIPPRWAADMNYGYGTPVLNFYYPLLNYLVSLFYSLGIGFELAYKFLIGTFFILSGLTFYLFLSTKFGKEVSFGGAILYMLAPYHFLDLFVRGHLGEMMALAFIPLVFYFIDRNIKKISILNVALGSIFYTLLILSHNILALMFSTVLLFYILIFSRKSKFIFNILIVLFGLGISAYFWGPVLLEGKYINSEVFVNGYFVDHFIKIQNLIYAPWGFGADINKAGGLSPQIGIIPAILVILSIFSLKNKNRIRIYFWLAVIFVSIFLSTSISSIIWSNIHILEQFQFPWRFMAIISFANTVLGAYFLSIIKNKIIIFLIIGLIIISSISYVKAAGFKIKPDSFYLNYSGTGAYHGEGTTIWTTGDASSYPGFPVEIIAGEGEISNYERKSNFHKFIVKAESSVKVKDNTVYYPGWRVFVNGQEKNIEFQDPNHRGLITFDAPKGSYDVEVKFTEIVLRKAANLISVISIVFIIMLLIFRNKFDKLILRR